MVPTGYLEGPGAGVMAEVASIPSGLHRAPCVHYGRSNPDFPVESQEILLAASPRCFKERPKSTSSPSQWKPGLLPPQPPRSRSAPGPCTPAALAFFKVLDSPLSPQPQEPHSHCALFGDAPLPSFTYALSERPPSSGFRRHVLHVVGNIMPFTHPKDIQVLTS